MELGPLLGFLLKKIRVSTCAKFSEKLTTSLGIHKTACLTDLFTVRFYCVETSHLICGAYGNVEKYYGKL